MNDGQRKGVGYRDFVRGFRDLGLDGARPAIAHVSLSAYGHVRGGAQTVSAALMEHFESLIVPTFTYKTMVVPEVGPPNNAMDYGSATDANRTAEFFHLDMPADALMGVVAETIRRQPHAERSWHPILSFAGVNAEDILDAQTPGAPLEPIRELYALDGWVLLLGVEHTVNTSIHLGERLAGRRTFTRWALTPNGVVECPGFPSCSDGFKAFAPHLEHAERSRQIGEGLLRAYPMRKVVDTARALVRQDPLALLCDRPDCPRCTVIRAEVTRVG